MVTSIVYTLIGLILCFVLYIAFRAINTGMEAKKANKDLENSNNINLENQEDLVKKLSDLKNLHEKNYSTMLAIHIVQCLLLLLYPNL